MSFRRESVPRSHRSGDIAPRPYQAHPSSPEGGHWVAIADDVSIWDQPANSRRLSAIPFDHQQTAAGSRNRHTGVGQANSAHLEESNSPRRSQRPIPRWTSDRPANGRSSSHRQARSNEDHAMEIDYSRSATNHRRPSMGSATRFTEPSRAERMQDIRTDYHNADHPNETYQRAGPSNTTVSSGSSRSVLYTPSTSPSASQAQMDLDYTLALALQAEEDEQRSRPRISNRRDQDQELAEELQYGFDHDMTDDDAAYAALVHEEEEALRMRASEPQKRTCIVCSDDLYPLGFPAKPPSSECTHTVNTCTSCLEKCVAADLEGRGWQRISCPECRELLNHSDMQRAAAADVFERYDQLATRGVLGADDSFHWCLGEGCGSGQMHEDPDGQNPVFQCMKCHLRQCLKHKIPWHDNETCEQYDYRLSGQADRDRRAQEDEASEATANSTTQACPKSTCRAKIEKKTGCDHMSCR